MAWRNYSKYGNKKVVINGETFDSKHEAERWLQLKLYEETGKISNLQRQVKFTLIPTIREIGTEVYKKGENKGKIKPGKVLEREVSYYADFVYNIEGSKTPIVEDAKGMKTKEYIIKRKLMLWVHGIRIKEV